MSLAKFGKAEPKFLPKRRQQNVGFYGGDALAAATGHASCELDGDSSSC
jgi:hypothetical protein